MAMTLSDDLDVDTIVARYTRGKSKILCLFAAMILLFTGCFGTFVTLQGADDQLTQTHLTVVQLAELAVNSPTCEKNPGDERCRKAQAVLDNPNAATQQAQAEDLQLIP